VEFVWAGNYLALRVGDEARARELFSKAKAAAGAKPEVIAAVEANLRWLDGR
jgi:hypothetical protein